MFDIAILGFGTVGSGVMEVIEKNADRIAQNAAQEIRVKYIVDVRDFPGSPYEKLMTKDFSVVENDPDVKVVVETIGGVGAAYEFTRRSLMKGKSVVTSNKELVATHGYELMQIAREKGVNYLFEASVGGGIPIIRPITQCLAANRINEIYGVLNGTTNFILTEMERGRLSFGEALREAQARGYAEANPEADVKGYDVCRKICILAALCFGRHVYPDYVPTEGIESITSEDIRLAGQAGYRIKLLGRAIHIGGKVAVYVAPHLVGKGSLLSGVDGVMNGIIVRGNAIGDVMFYGAGAGKLPTASAVVADIIDAAKHVHARKWLSWDDGSPDMVYDSRLLEHRWYVRAKAAPEEVRGAFAQAEIIGIAAEGGCALFTPLMSKKSLESALYRFKVATAFRIIE